MNTKTSTVYFRQINTFSDREWSYLRGHLEYILGKAQGLGISIRNKMGDKVITDVSKMFSYSNKYKSNIVVFNGEQVADEATKPFTLIQHKRQLEQQFDIADEHYGWFIRVVLICLESHFKAKVSVRSFDDLKLWERVTSDIGVYFDYRKIPAMAGMMSGFKTHQEVVDFLLANSETEYGKTETVKYDNSDYYLLWKLCKITSKGGSTSHCVRLYKLMGSDTSGNWIIQNIGLSGYYLACEPKRFEQALHYNRSWRQEICQHLKLKYEAA